MSWRTAKCLDVLLHQVDAAYPGRDKSSDGTLGDAAHQATKSEHNPDANGIVRARDITNDPAHGLNARTLAEALIASRDNRILYVISNAQICSSVVSPWVWRPYSGVNAHRQHMHLSVVESPALYDDERPWNIDLAPAPPKEGHVLIKIGDHGPAVEELQGRLGVAVDGDFGPQTDAAVRAFQASHGLNVDGEVGPKTWAALLASPQTQPANVQTSKGSWYSQYDGKYHWHDGEDKANSAALGVPDDAQGIARPQKFGTLGAWFMVRAPNGKVSIEQQTDHGPGASTGRTIDIAAVAGERFGYSPTNFPTDSIFTFWPVDPPAEVAGMSKQQQAIKYRDMRKDIKVAEPTPIPDKPTPQPKPAPIEPQLPAVLTSKIDVGRVLQFVVDHKDEAFRILTIAVNLHNTLHPDRKITLPAAPAVVPIATPPTQSILEKPSVAIGATGVAISTLLQAAGVVGLPFGLGGPEAATFNGTLSTLLPAITAGLGMFGVWGRVAGGALTALTPIMKAINERAANAAKAASQQ